MRGLTGALFVSFSLFSFAALPAVAAAEVPPPPPPAPGAAPVAPPNPPPPYGYPPAPGYAPPAGAGYPPPPPYPYGYPPAGGGAPGAYYRRPPKPGFHQHDGFYLRLFLGGGYLDASAKIAGVDLDMHGGGGAFGAAAGAAVIENLILYGELTFFVVPEPTKEAGGAARVATGQSMVAVGLGPGAAYYFMPINVYLSATVGLSKLNLEENVSDSSDTQVVASTRWGFGLNLKAGKEFWLSHNWGLGVALQYQFASMADNSDPAPQFHLHGFSVVGSATFN